MKRVFILLEGGVVDLLQFHFNKEDIFICADGGFKRIINRELKNKIIVIGDFDSINKKLVQGYNLHIKKFPRNKDKTDGELAINYACQHFSQKIKKIIVGGITDRLDHTLGNINILIPHIKKEHSFEIYGDKIKVNLTNNPIKLYSAKNNIVSLIAVAGPVIKVKTKGLKWLLNNETINPYSSRTLRNEAISNEVLIDFKKGVLMIIETW